MEYQLTRENFEDEVLKSDITVLVDFYADWCGPCRSMMPKIEKIAQEYEGRVKVGTVNSDLQPELTQVLRVVTIPNFFIFKNGEIVDHVVGTIARRDLEKKLDAVLQDSHGVL